MLSHVVRTRASGNTATEPETRPETEPELVIENREALIFMLCEAAELEHALMCEYLFAAFSMKERTDQGLTAEQADAVGGWRSVLLGVAAQEMLHLALNANMLTALGASPHLSRPNLPQPARHYPPGVRLLLLPFGEQALRHFMYLERPEGMDLKDAEGVEASADAVAVMSREDIAPYSQDFSTVGHLYRSIAEGFRHLTEKFGAERVFVGPPQAQITQTTFAWPELIAVSDLASATSAIEEIVEQGEGARGDWRNAHFGRFKRVLDELLALRRADPDFEPARPVIAARVRPGEGEWAGAIIDDPTTAKVADLFNVVYEVLLLVLYRLLARIDESDADVALLADVAVGLMSSGIEPLGTLLGTMPVGGAHDGCMAGAPFELFYQPDYLLPHHRAAWQLFAERLEEAASFATRLSAAVPPLVGIAGDLQGFADRLTAKGP